jgi:hypothetical protein
MVKLPHVNQPFRVKLKVTHSVNMCIYMSVFTFRLSVSVSAQVTVNTAKEKLQISPIISESPDNEIVRLFKNMANKYENERNS